MTDPDSYWELRRDIIKDQAAENDPRLRDTYLTPHDPVSYTHLTLPTKA